MLLHILCFVLVLWPSAAPNTGAAAQTMAQRNVLPASAGGRAGATTALVNGRTFSNTRIMGQVGFSVCQNATPDQVHTGENMI
jgi:hypothetical protein